MDHRDDIEQEIEEAVAADGQGAEEVAGDPVPALGDAVPPSSASGEAKPVEDRRLIVQKGTEELDSRVRMRSESRSVAEAEAVGEAHEVHVVAADDAPLLLLISGSPRRHTSVSLVDLIERGAREAGVRTQRFQLCEKRVNPCIGCNACAKTGECVFARRRTPSGTQFIDDYLELTEMIESCDGLAVVAPVYFTGPTAQLKALYDRFQPYWARKYVIGEPFPPRRPAQLFIIGAGGDPHGNEPMTTISRSALQIAGFELEKVNNFVGYKAPSDVPVEPTSAELEEMTLRQRNLVKQGIARQAEFCARAIDAGRAFGRVLHAGQESIRGERQD